MTDDKNSTPSDNEQKKGLEQFYQFDKKEPQKEDGDYFTQVRMTLTKVKSVSQKIVKIRKELERKISELRAKAAAEAKSNNKQSKQNNQAPKDKQKNNKNNGENMVQADLAFCEAALSETDTLNVQNDGDVKQLETILTTKKEQPYSVVVDIALRPLPSDRNKGKEKGKEDDKGANGGNDNNKKEQGSKKPLTKEQLEALRKGQSLSAQKGENTAQPAQVLPENSTEKEEVQPQNSQGEKKKMTAQDFEKLRNGIPFNPVSRPENQVLSPEKPIRRTPSHDVRIPLSRGGEAR